MSKTPECSPNQPPKRSKLERIHDLTPSIFKNFLYMTRTSSVGNIGAVFSPSGAGVLDETHRRQPQSQPKAMLKPRSPRELGKLRRFEVYRTARQIHKMKVLPPFKAVEPLSQGFVDKLKESTLLVAHRADPSHKLTDDGYQQIVQETASVYSHVRGAVEAGFLNSPCEIGLHVLGKQHLPVAITASEQEVVSRINQ